MNKLYRISAIDTHARQLTIGFVAGVHAVFFAIAVPRLVDAFARRHAEELVGAAKRRWLPRGQDARRHVGRSGATLGVCSRRAVAFVRVVVTVRVAIAAPRQRDALLVAALPLVYVARHRL